MIFISCLCLVVGAKEAEAQPISEFNETFAIKVAKTLRERSIPGASYVIVQHDEIKALETYGFTDKSKKHAIDETTVFRLASVSKPFAATIAMQLAQEGKLNIKAPITHFIPDFNLATEGAAEKIQVQHVLSHTSGLLPNTYDNLLHENWSMHKIIKRFEKLKPICQPKKCYGYQNILYGFLAEVIENSQPQSYQTLIQERLFKPLNMTQSSIGQSAYLAQENHAKPHVLIHRRPISGVNANGKKRMKYTWRQVNVKEDFYKVPAAAGVNASITDMAKWLKANLGYAPDVLSPELLARMTTPQIRTKKDLRRRYWRELISDAHYGLGWRIYQVNNYQLIYHGGWVEGFRAEVGYAPELGIGFAMLMNAESNTISELSAQFWQHVFSQAEKNMPVVTRQTSS